MDNLYSLDTLPRPLGGEPYLEIADSGSGNVTLTYNDLWLMIVCQSSLDGDWARVREAAGMVPDPTRKRAIADRLCKLERSLGGLPPVPQNVMRLNLHRAHKWFNERTVSEARNW